MNQTHIHLIITHLPIFGSLFGMLVLLYGTWQKNSDTKVAAYLVFIISGLGSVIAYYTGEAAEEAVENLQGVVHATIESHEEFALIGLISLIVLGGISILSTILTLKKSTHSSILSTLTIIVAFISFCLAARTAYLGGKIRHTEIEMVPSVIHDKIENED
ncbi:MAG: hypothetical protein MUC81_10960 [Bacteroidia bacterium]|jgi:membrane protein YqaA with SNARE-associated domain|nr:hypothetical protein [Bacteroidia bacterium]